MKKCTKCKTEKDYTLFNKSSKYKDGLHIYCKDCNSISSKIYRDNNVEKTRIRKKIYNEAQKNKTQTHYVYLLPLENYVGTTKNIYDRMSKHRTRSGRDISGYRILYKSDNRNDALELERLLHDIGYLGRHINNMYK
ncbi:hypothetical protein UFOVP639_23 [uncultured Caudovirales phage]|uniref:GIY-YIG domain-containing protein n=1 Tax=uncultured Caudovirales phage TaxID=2100421 RepID=A0A6J5N9B5_9CAUD|nr:hypothetical protein UFOVP639_23 [uncultured Caudovirales phage]